MVGTWEGSKDYIGALLYNHKEKEGVLIAGSAIECSIVVKGIGLEIDQPLSYPLPDKEAGEVSSIAAHALSLSSDAMVSPNQTIKFVRMMTLFEFLANPYEYENWSKSKGNIICHCVKDKKAYHKLIERFKELTSDKTNGVESGLRTLIVHQGKLIEELLPNLDQRNSLFQELQIYSGKVISDMINNSSSTWPQFCDYRKKLKLEIGI